MLQSTQPDFVEYGIVLIGFAIAVTVVLIFMALIILGAYKDISKRVAHNRIKHAQQQLASRIRLLHLTAYIEKNASETGDLVAYRFAGLVWREGKPYFSSIFKPAVFTASDDAVCLAGGRYFAEHRAPEDNCRCGFYSIGHAASLPEKIHTTRSNYNLYCLLQVQVSGKVIPGSRGYRAEHQEVLHVWLPGRCARYRCRAVAMVTSETIGRSIVKDREIDKPLIPACKWHSRGSEHVVTELDLAGLLNTEFSWLA